MYKSKKGLVAALTGMLVSILIGILFTKKKNALNKVVSKGKNTLEKGKETLEKGKEKIKKTRGKVSNYTERMQEKAKDIKEHLKTAND